MNLPQTWMEERKAHGHSLKSATADMNVDLGTRYSTSRVCEWRNGRVPVPPRVRAYMIEFALFHALREEGIDVYAVEDDAWTRIFRRIL